MKRTSFLKFAIIAGIALMAGVSFGMTPHETVALGATAMANHLSGFGFDPATMLMSLGGFGTIAGTSKNLRDLQARRAKHIGDMRAINDKAAAESRDITDEEDTAYKAAKTSLSKTDEAIAREQETIAAEASSRGVVIRAGANISVEENIDKDKTLGFPTLGAFAQAVRQSSLPNGQQDARFAAAPGVFGGEGAGTDGGFLIPPQYATEIFTLAQAEDSLLPYTDNVEITSNSLVFPKDETTPWGTDGVRAYWQGEAAVANATKPKIGITEQRLKKLMALVPLSDELVEDSNALTSYLPGKLADSIRWKTNEAFMFGAGGSGIPQGAFNSGALVTVAKESGQATATLQIQNIAKMIARLPAGSYGRAIWQMNNDVLPSLFTLTLGNYPIYIPASEGAKMNPYGTLMGRPIMVTQHAKSFSSQGDLLLADYKYYRSITKAGGIQMATSLHLYFDADAMAFRATFRVDGQSKIAAPITPANGSNTLSPFIQLGAR